MYFHWNFADVAGLQEVGTITIKVIQITECPQVVLIPYKSIHDICTLISGLIGAN